VYLSKIDFRNNKPIIKIMKKNHFIWAGMTFTILLLSSCRKDKEEKMIDTVETRNESVNSFVEKNVSADEDAVSQKNMIGGSGSLCGWTGYFNSCAEVTEDNTDYPKLITIDFGEGCTGPGGYTRSGIMYVHLTAPFDESGAIRTVTFENYSINGIGITGSRVTTNMGENSNNQPVFARVVNIFFNYDSETFHRNFTSEITWLAGFDTEECGDNDWKVTGTGTNTRADGTMVSRTITSPLYHLHSCDYITQGVVSVLAPAGSFTVNYGNGTCDNTATVTGPNGNTIDISLNP
jgi:hypothetical protein